LYAIKQISLTEIEDLPLSDVETIQEQYKIVGRETELECALAAIRARKHIFFEGIVGVGKTVIANALASYFKKSFYRVDGDERYTGHKLIGWFDPALVLPKGYSLETFIPGPLTQAMMEGSFLFINELNRMPEGTQNVLLPAMDEMKIIIPKIGALNAKPGFLIIATQNPEEFVGTSRLGEALKDRFVWIRLDYQSEEEEQRIVIKETGYDKEDLVGIAVKIGRATRDDVEIRRGASVRGAIDIVALLQQLSKDSITDPDVWIKASIMALATKIELRDEATKKIDEVIKRIVTTVLKEASEKTPKKKTR
jgi:MoxR-like ATPase